MTGPEHYQEAEGLLAFADSPAGRDTNEADQAIKAAQVHATLALAMATVHAASATRVGYVNQEGETVTYTNDPAVDQWLGAS